MSTVRMAILTGLMASAAGESRAGPAADGGLAERVARVFSPEMRRTEARLGQLAEQLASLPELRAAPFASRYGFRSEIMFGQEQPQWVQIDLGRSCSVDCVVAVPTHIPSLGARGAGYGFPLRFRIELADDPEMAGAVTVVDRTAEDVENPGRYPMIFRLQPGQGRYVRFTSTRHFPVEEGFIWALEELVLLSGNNTVGVGEIPKASSSLELFPNWSEQRVNDGQSALGMPVTAEPSPTRGYQSATTENPQEEKWLRVDLGREYAIDEIRLVPVESPDYEVLGLQSFPRAWKVELANDPDFTRVTWRHQRERTNLAGAPGGCAEVVLSNGHRGRYLRLVAQDLWGQAYQCGFGLAEIQAYAGGENVALGKPVEAKDAIDNAESSGWGPDFVTDGFSSRHRLIEYPEYLDLIDRRGRLAKEQELLLAARDHKVRVTGRALGYGGGTLGSVALLGWGWMLLRQRTVRNRAVAQLRDQIARDLHDDIGSNLGGIVLLSERWSRQSGEPEAREGFRTIKEAAEETSASMQDIVWLIQRGSMGLRDLVARMRQSAQAILGDEPLSLTVDPPGFRDRPLSLFFRRHVFFSFKETLNNVRRHARATAVEVRITLDSTHLTFSVRDDGVGFDPQRAAATGHGLNNLMRRAARLKGTCHLESSPGQGTRVSFTVPLRS
jgi:signal transduction histidine kinase